MIAQQAGENGITQERRENASGTLSDLDPLFDELSRCLLDLGVDEEDDLILEEVVRRILELLDPEYPR